MMKSTKKHISSVLIILILIFFNYLFANSEQTSLDKINLILINKVTGKAHILTISPMQIIQCERITIRAREFFHVSSPIPITSAFVETWYQCPDTKSLRLLTASWINNLNHIAIHQNYDLGIQLSFK